MEIMDIEKTLQIIKSREHPLKVKLIQLLSIYNELSTSELVKKSGKTKPTILKHLNELVELGEVAIRTEASPGAYDRNIYSLKNRKYEIRGQDLHAEVRKNPEFMLNYNNFKLSDLLILKDIIDSMVEYQRRLNQEVSNHLNNPDKIIKLMKDNLGESHFEYLTRKQLFEEEVSEANVTREYLKIRLTLPIRRIIEQLSLDEWQIDGTLWKYS